MGNLFEESLGPAEVTTMAVVCLSLQAYYVVVVALWRRNPANSDKSLSWCGPIRSTNRSDSSSARLRIALTTQPTHDLKQLYLAQPALCWLASLLQPVSKK